jgi:enoyl-CoA hydratase
VSSGSVELHVADGCAHLVLNNPTRRNAITKTMAEQLIRFCAEIDGRDDIGAVVVSGAGDYFCSGADVAELAAASADPTSDQALAQLSAVYRSFATLSRLSVPTITAVAGGVYGAGLNLALAGDVMLVTPDAVLASGFLRTGIHPGGGHLTLLSQRIGHQGAAAMALFSVPLTGEEAVRRGLAWQTCPIDELVPTALRLAAAPARDGVLARAIKHSLVLEREAGTSVDAAIEVERGMQLWSLARKGPDGWSRPAR